MILDKISYISTKVEKSLRLGVPCCNEEALILLLLNRADTTCLSKKELTVYNNILKNLSYDCKVSTNKVIVNSNNKEQWEEANPECISRKQWEKIALKICNKYNIEVSIEKINSACDIAFEITKNTIHCDVLTLISIQQKLCELDIKIETNKNQCNIDYKLLLEKFPTCQLSIKEYITLIESGYSFEILSGLYKNNVKLEVDSRGKVTLISSINKYSLPDDLKFTEIVLDNENNIVLPKRILDDYNINKKTKKQILDGISII
jgi:hypothetical protein